MRRSSELNSNSSYASPLNGFEAIRNAYLAFGVSGVTFSSWWYAVPALIAAIPSDKKSITKTLLFRTTGLVMGVVAFAAGCAGLHQVCHALLPSKKNPAFDGQDLSQAAVQKRTMILGLTILTMHVIWYFTPSGFSIPLHFKRRVHEIFVLSQISNLAAYGISRAQGNLKLPQSRQ